MAHKGLPHNAVLNYNGGAINSQSWSSSGKCNLAKDFSLTNRQHWEQTTAKGVPLVYRCAFTFSPQLRAFGSDGDYSDIFEEDTNQVQVIAIQTASQNWVMRNAAVKTHAAREKMYKHAGVTKSDRGSYDGTIHYTWEAGPDTFLTPIDGDRDAFTGGSWEYSKLIMPNDTSGAYINVIGTHATEESNETFSTVSLPQMYLSSRKQVDDDSNTDDDDQPAMFSILNKLLAPQMHAIQDEVVDLARDNQDEPPYDLAEDGDWCEPIEAARVYLGITSGVQQTVIIDVPFGLCEVLAINSYVDGGANRTNGVDWKVEVLDIFPMGAE